jgi:osmoprotectant transport system substrate-binding protein
MRRALLCVLLVFGAGCSSSTTHADGQLRPDDGAVVVASFNFSESKLVAEIYAQALERAGIPVRRELDLGPRELVQPALDQGLVDLVPEYLGSALLSIYPELRLDTSDPTAVRTQLSAALAPKHLELLAPAPAQDQNGLAMLEARATELGVRTVSDLRHHPNLVLGGPPECPTRDFCLRGLRQVYGLAFTQFVPLASLAQEQTALEQGVIDVAVVFTTDGHLAEQSLTLLDDDLHLQPAENIVPVVSTRSRERYGERLTRALDAVSSQLTSAGLTFLNWRVDIDGKSVADEASGWLARHP